MTYRLEEELTGTAGGVRNVADFLTGGGDDTFLVLAGDALTDVDLTALVAAHRAQRRRRDARRQAGQPTSASTG